VPLTAAEKEQMFVDILPDAGEDDGSAVLSFYVEETETGDLVIEDEIRTPDQVRREMSALIERLQKNFELFWEKAKPPPPLKPPIRQKGQESPEHTKSS
jgi:ribosomal protein L11 methyltransferase